VDSLALGTEPDQRLGCLGSGAAEQCATRVSNSAGERQPALPAHGPQARQQAHPRQQRDMARAIKTAREMALLPYSSRPGQ